MSGSGRRERGAEVGIDMVSIYCNVGRDTVWMRHDAMSKHRRSIYHDKLQSLHG